jgi:hypothetical protein
MRGRNKTPSSVIPAKAGTQVWSGYLLAEAETEHPQKIPILGSRFRGNDNKTIGTK